MQFEPFIAHRGARTRAPENTMPAFKKAVTAGLNWIELDVQLSRDGQPFIFHDHNGERLLGTDCDPTTLTWKQLRKLSLQETFNGRRPGVPSLRRYLDWMAEQPNLYTNIELKVNPASETTYQRRLADAVLLTLADYPELQPRLMLSSFSYTVMEMLAASDQAWTLEMLLYFTDWDTDFDYFRRVDYARYHRWNCVAVGINGDCLTAERVTALKDLCGPVLAYCSPGRFDSEAVLTLFGYGVDTIFIDDMAHIRLLEQAPRMIRVGFLSTGDEITAGEIADTNTPEMAATLHEQGFYTGWHISCGDDRYQLEKALRILLDNHEVVVTVGGLGPTEDDKTRQALAWVLDQPLEFYQESWDRITRRLEQRFAVIPETNRQQAYFPRDATILPNRCGTADGCLSLAAGNRKIFMLPGPPSECRAMFSEQVIPALQAQHADVLLHYRWQLIGVSEAVIAARLSPLAERFGFALAYRCEYPYIEVKLQARRYSQSLGSLFQAIEQETAPYLMFHGPGKGSERLKSLIQHKPVYIRLKQDVTRGYVVSRMTALNHIYGHTAQHHPVVTVYLNGLEQYWHNREAASDTLMLTVYSSSPDAGLPAQADFQMTIGIKPEWLLDAVYEWVCASLVGMLEKEDDNNGTL